MGGAESFALSDLDSVFHTPARLAIVTALFAHPRGLSFVELRSLCELTDGNLSRQLRKLEEAQVVTIIKEFSGRMPLTTARLTDGGRKRYMSYIEQLERLVDTANSVRGKANKRRPAPGSPAPHADATGSH